MNTVKWWEWGLKWGLEYQGIECEWCFVTRVQHVLFNGGLKTGHRVKEHCKMVGVGLTSGRWEWEWCFVTSTANRVQHALLNG